MANMAELSEKEFCSLPEGTVIITPEGESYLIGDLIYPENPNVPCSNIRRHKFDHKGCRLANAEEVDLEREINDYFITVDLCEGEKITENTFRGIAEHFFELGLKAQKGRVIPKRPITEFEREVAVLLGYHCLETPEVIAILRGKSDNLLSFARKQIAEEIEHKTDINDMVNSKTTWDSKAKKYYRKGIEGAFLRIKQGLIRKEE